MKVINFIILFSLFSCAIKQKITDPIKGPIASKQNKYRQCFVESDSYRGRFAKIEGEVDVEFLITSEGRVKEAKVKDSDFKDPNLHACILDQIRQIKFETVTKETKVHQPINFIPEQS